MKTTKLSVMAALVCASAALASGQEPGGFGEGLREIVFEGDDGGSVEEVPVPTTALTCDSRSGAVPEDDLKASVIKHLEKLIAYCDGNMEACNGPGNELRNFAKGIGGGRCNNLGFNCVNEVLDMCRSRAADGEITPMYYMACAAMLGKMGERHCAGGRAFCAGDLQGTVYFSLRASAGCHKSYSKNAVKQAEAGRLMDRFSAAVKRNVKEVYVGRVQEAHSAGHHLAWHAGKEAGVIGAEKVLELAFERLAWHGAGAAVSAATAPLFFFSCAMLFHELAASEMNGQVCLNWDHDYGGSYANVAHSLAGMTRHIR